MAQLNSESENTCWPCCSHGHSLHSTWDILMQTVPKYRIHMMLRRAQCQAFLSTMIVSDNDRGTESPEILRVLPYIQ